jgi:hypothetical protein
VSHILLLSLGNPTIPPRLPYGEPDNHVSWECLVSQPSHEGGEGFFIGGLDSLRSVRQMEGRSLAMGVLVPATFGWARLPINRPNKYIDGVVHSLSYQHPSVRQLELVCLAVLAINFYHGDTQGGDLSRVAAHRHFKNRL